ncbi:MAG: RNA-directed DNA polymerase [Proteobacteria bacterium]|nr:RNA-directed DNA polymerase [Pseudomonadota bacterium]
MTIYRTILSRGYFPKELPPAFFTEQFANYATTKRGRAILAQYKPTDNFTQCVDYRLALLPHDARVLRIPNPAAFSTLAELVSKNLRRLLKSASRSPFSKSRPIYATNHARAIHGMVAPPNLAKERTISRGGARYLVKTDVSQFYPSLYTHAVGWAIDPQLRNKKNWGRAKLLGKRLDQALMNSQGKISQGIPIGNDISFLLGEVVLAQVDRSLKMAAPERCYRWYDDYEIACDSYEEAGTILRSLRKALENFQLRTNPIKTEIVALPVATVEDWKDALLDRAKETLSSARDMVQYFDAAFRLRERYPNAPVLLYALGLLFRLRRPADAAARVAQSGISQCLLSEPGCAQKAFALLTFWKLNGLALDDKLLRCTVTQIVKSHRDAGVESDVSWALAFCSQNSLPLAKSAARLLSELENDCVAIQSLHLDKQGLLPDGFRKTSLTNALKSQDPEGEHWLAGYEAVRHGFVAPPASAYSTHTLFRDMLACKVTFYRTRLPAYASIIHPGGAPEWAVREWLHSLVSQAKRKGKGPSEGERPEVPMLRLIESDLVKVQQARRPAKATADTVFDLLDVFEPEAFAALLEDEEPYSA